MSADNIVLVVKEGELYQAYDCSFSDVSCYPWSFYEDDDGYAITPSQANHLALEYCKKFGYFLDINGSDSLQVCKNVKESYWNSESPLEYGIHSMLDKPTKR